MGTKGIKRAPNVAFFSFGIFILGRKMCLICICVEDRDGDGNGNGKGNGIRDVSNGMGLSTGTETVCEKGLALRSRN